MSGYNETAYREARQSAIDKPCPFERALLARCVSCHKARKVLLAEREAMSCTDTVANMRCQAFYAAAHQNARFALHSDPNQPWPFGKEIRAQCGSVLGLQRLAPRPEEQGETAQPSRAADIAALLDSHTSGMDYPAQIAALPWSEIMRSVVHFEPRKRRP